MSKFQTPLLEHRAAPLVVPWRASARGLLGDCDLRWLGLSALLCALVLRLVAGH
ncbi:MAG: hypothetical protein IT204_07420 [Fimbriimonadaceae bacterium]|nr:hypothetical protein [Fimbriimonadaceae bacterium]